MIIDNNGDEVYKIKESVTFSDVLLVPQYSEIMSRKTIDIGSSLSDDLHFSLPLISSPMDTITESTMAITMAKHGGLGILHRYNSIHSQANMAGHSNTVVGAAVGVTGDYVERTKQLVKGWRVPIRNLIRFAMLGLILTVSGCATNSALPPEITNYIPCQAVEPFYYRDGDTEETKLWGDNYNSAWEVLCGYENARE